LACLAAKAIPQRQVAEGAGVPFSTVTKIAQGVVTDPSVHTVQKLHDYFAGQRSAFPALPQGATLEAST
jgi:transcriptional regulator with XRE-family HTH domain